MSFFPHGLAAPVVRARPVIVWEEPACLLCGRRNASLLVEAPDITAGGTGLWFAVVQCQECGLCFTSPRPNAGSISQFYPSVYRPHRTSNIRRPRWRLPGLEVRKGATKEHRVLSWRGPGRLLDFGCGGGAFLAHMHRQAWQVTGLDVSTAAIQRIRAELGLRAIVGTLPHPDLRPASFEVITMWHSLEHVHAPLDVLREAHRLLVPNGKLFVAVPNIDSLPFRWFGSAWYGLDLPRHLSHFAPWTLHFMLEKAGFRVGQTRMVRHSDWLRSSAKRACQAASASLWHRWLTAKPLSRLATWYCHFRHQADCILVSAER